MGTQQSIGPGILGTLGNPGIDKSRDPMRGGPLGNPRIHRTRDPMGGPPPGNPEIQRTGDPRDPKCLFLPVLEHIQEMSTNQMVFRRPTRIILWQLGPPRTILGAFYELVTFERLFREFENDANFNVPGDIFLENAGTRIVNTLQPFLQYCFSSFSILRWEIVLGVSVYFEILLYVSPNGSLIGLSTRNLKGTQGSKGPGIP